MGTLKDDLCGPGISIRETHISWVFLAEHDVWKVKKPVNLGFLDFGTTSKRRRACEAEVRLNRRLSPETYRGVVPVTRDAAGRHRFGGDDEAAVDWAVHMKRLPDADRADGRVRDGRLTDEHLERVARRLARFHDACDVGPEAARWGSPAAIRGNVEENFEQIGDRLLHYLKLDRAKELLHFQLGFVDDRAALLERRIDRGRVRDGPGDLRLEHVYVDADERVDIIDCIEFNDRFRYADVCADVAFLAMDLARNGHPFLAERFLALYARESDDYELYPLVDFYQSYRACVRGKIAAMEREDDTRSFFQLALATSRKPLPPPFVLAVGGPIASGKSTLADAVAALAALPVVDSDRARKSLVGVAHETSLPHRAWQGAYSPEVTERVYEEIFHRAGSVLDSGRAVLLDASFPSTDKRQAAERLASARNIPFIFAECRVPEPILRDRLRRRDQRASVSDGRLDILDSFLERWVPADELDPDVRLVVDTSSVLERSARTVVRALQARLPSMGWMRRIPPVP